MKKFVCMALTLAMVTGMMSGCGGGGEAAKEDGGTETLKVGMTGCYTGEYAQYGLAVQNGANLYFEKVNAAGGINGKLLEVISYDNKASDADAVNAFTRLVDEGITAYLGDVLTSNTQAVVGEAFPINMPMITPSATAEAVTYDAEGDTVYTNVFRTCFIDPFQGQKMAQYAKEVLSAKTAAVIFETGNDYAVGLKDAFLTECAAQGITAVEEQGYAKGDMDFKSQMTTIASKNPDVVFCPNYYENDGMIVTQARQAGLKATFLGGDGWGGVAKYASAADLEGSVYCSAYASGSSEEITAFETAYVEAYGKDAPLNMFAATAYDAAVVLCNALTKAETTGEKPGSDAYKQAVIDAIRDQSAALDDCITSAGYTFDAHNNPVKDAVLIKLVGGAEVFDRLF
ncbi:MAG: ABC transporter substrate-binding protein [Oscillospiraceae bacterium]